MEGRTRTYISKGKDEELDQISKVWDGLVGAFLEDRPRWVLAGEEASEEPD